MGSPLLAFALKGIWIFPLSIIPEALGGLKCEDGVDWRSVRLKEERAALAYPALSRSRATHSNASPVLLSSTARCP